MPKFKTFIYSAQRDQFRKDAVYENPRYFEKLPPQGLHQYEEVIVIGSWPRVEAALEAAEIKYRHGDKDDDKDVPRTDNTGIVRSAPTGSQQGSNRQKEGTLVAGPGIIEPVNEGEGDTSNVSVATTGDGEETVARETGVKTEEVMDGTTQENLAPADADEDAIPDNWEELSWPDLRNLASKHSADTITNKAQATEVVRAKYEARKG